MTISQQSDTVRCFGLVATSLLLLPITISIICIRFIFGIIFTTPDQRVESRDSPQDDSARRTILVTGVGMAKGLALARSFYLSGHRVIGADFEKPGIPCSGRHSRSLSTFYRLPNPGNNRGNPEYASRLVEIVNSEDIELWVSCSGVANALDDAFAKELVEQHTPCKCVQFDPKTTAMLHGKATFMEECEKLGLPIPETHQVKSVRDTLRILEKRMESVPERKYILKPTGMDDVNRGNMTTLPLASMAETKEHISQLPISEFNPWVLQQFIPGKEEYCTHALIVRGEVRCFVACPSSELLMHYRALTSDSPLWWAMFTFTVEFVRRFRNSETMTGHLSFDFMVSGGKITLKGFEKKIYAIECNPRAHTAVVLFAQLGPERDAMVNAYLDVLEGQKEIEGVSTGSKRSSSNITESLTVPPNTTLPRYWIGHDLVSLLGLTGSIDSGRILPSTVEFLSHLLSWKEGTFEMWDPIPALSLYHLYWPMSILSSWWHGERWSKINVSTTKMFTYQENGNIPTPTS
ncbi:hypothetical protein F5Y04DRAFT_272785 [Hypomontagnella monticulosa]|nr:hypothetical protein F5Y04DRAFT_272785 [Hypomontagnella monticulosa]